MSNLKETAIKAGFKTLIQAIEATKLDEDILEQPGIYTVFAPTDDAFAQLPEGTLESLLQDVHKLKRIVAYHIVFGDVRSDDLAQIDEAPTVEGSVLAIESADGEIKVNDANVLKTDILSDNGVIHVIDAVLIPTMVAVN
jgi:uncharacterized surface protein with fasciclin (FAS1) repeats